MFKLNWIEALGDRNPQLLRELKGRLKLRNLISTVVISLLGQFLLWVFFLMRIPHPTADLTVYKGSFPATNFYCTGAYVSGNNRKCLVNAAGDLLVDWQRWSLDLCSALSVIGICGLLLIGTYLLINNLAQEERRGTLNFIRLSPRSPQNILWGKMLGVPILLYIAVLLAIPLHLGAGIAAHISLIRILSFYGIVVTSCVFFYSFSLLFGLISSGLKDLQAFLGSGAVSLLLLIGLYEGFFGDAVNGIKIFSPTTIRYLVSVTDIEPRLHWFNLPVGMSLAGITSMTILNYSLWTYWIWQAIERRFTNPSKTMLSKVQSYWFVACFEIVALGFAINSIRFYTGDGDSHRYRPGDNLMILLVYNFVLFCGLIVILTPQRQALVDWARYQKQKPHNRNLLTSLLRLVWEEKSPATLAIALNGIIAAIILISWIVLEMGMSDRLPILMALVFNLCIIVVCAAISQLVTLMQRQKSGLLIIGTIGAVIVLPPTILFLLPVKIPALWWLFTVFALGSIQNVESFSIFLALLGQLAIVTWCSVQVNRQLKKAGVSNSISLFAPPKALLP